MAPETKKLRPRGRAVSELGRKRRRQRWRPVDAASPVYKHRQRPTDDFKHEPLDHELASIRLIQILPDLSPAGRIQCTIRHTDVNDKYTCLSYVWGQADDNDWITVDGRLFQVHRNLWDFLDRARIRHHSKPLWIDALCIDQGNILERNHQVQQMGQIFGHAIEVIAWLGNDPDTAGFLAEVQAQPTLCYPTTVSPYAHGWYQYGLEFLYDFGRIEYWKRAWITQEMALAHRVTLFAMEEELDLALVPSTLFQSSGTKHVLNTLKGQTLKGKDLIELIDLFRDKECKVKRDRIFSLLAICGTGSDLQVDYSISDEALLLQTLRTCRKSCFCDIAIVARALKIQTPTTATSGMIRKANHARMQLKPSPKRSSLSTAYSFGCSACTHVLPHAWDNLKGLMFCLNIICSRVGCHLLWRTDAPEEVFPFYLSLGDEFSLPGENRGYGLGSGIQICKGLEDGFYNLQFSLEVILEIVGKMEEERKRVMSGPRDRGILTGHSSIAFIS